MPSANVPTILPGAQPLAGAGDDAPLDQVDQPVGQQLGVDAQVAVVAEPLQQGVGDGADAGLDGGAVGDPLGHVLGDGAVDLASATAGAHLDQRPVDLRSSPTTWLTWTWLRPNVRGIRSLTSRKNGTRPMNGAA